MKACLLRSPAPVETSPLEFTDVPDPEPGIGEVLVRVHCCGVCRTDLHVVEGELQPRKSPVIPGHQVVGVIERNGRGTKRFVEGARVGIAWLHHTDGKCDFCRSGAENLCDNPSFTGYTVDGGYAERIVAPEDFVYPIPSGFRDEQAAPLLCAGIIGFRSLRLSEIKPGERLGFYGFGAAAHVAIQVARHWNVEVYASTRDRRHQELALELGAVWAGGTLAQPPQKLDAAIVFAPAGEIVPAALGALRKGGRLVLGGIHMSPMRCSRTARAANSSRRLPDARCKKRFDGVPVSADRRDAQVLPRRTGRRRGGGRPPDGQAMCDAFPGRVAQ